MDIIGSDVVRTRVRGTHISLAAVVRSAKSNSRTLLSIIPGDRIKL